MRSKRLLSMLLVLCMMVSAMSPAVFATTASEDSYVSNAQNAEDDAAKITASPFENDNAVSAEDLDNSSSKNMRDDPILKPEVTEVEQAEGQWTAAELEGEVPDVDLALSETPAALAELKEAAELYDANEVVNAFVVMEDAPLADVYSSISFVSDADEDKLLAIQDAVIAMIEKYVLSGEKLDVRYQFTYLTNAFSVSTEFCNLAEIAQMDGVKSVYLMPVYSACETQTSTTVISNPTTASSGEMTGVPTVWEDLGYKGEGMKIAVIDTGLDLDHPSFAEQDDFVVTDSSLTVEDIDAVLKDLNAYALRTTVEGKTLYRSAKVPFAFNYVDKSLTADHSSDSQGDHGTHVAGIAAANDNVEGTNVVGMAPEAQIIVMKVFGANGGAYSDDILAALEDAMTLGCDVANLSLGAAAGFTTEDEEVDAIYERIAEQDIVVCIAAGNDGTSSYDNMWGTDLNLTTNPDNATVGSPGTYVNATTVASVENATVMSPFFSVGEEQVFYTNPYAYYYGMTDLVDWYGEDFAFEYVIVDGLGEEADFYDEDGNSLVADKIAVIKRGTISFADKIFNAQAAGAVAAVIWNNTEDDIYSFGMQISNDGETYPSIPACLITLADGQMMADAETKELVVSAVDGARGSAAGGQMSSFSSWGVSPDLSLEPEISGIGGNVYSCYDGGTYGIMSGTSMATPQVAGVTALVMQYLKEQFPNAVAGSLRTMAENLMMSNAEVIIDSTTGLEASPRQQGAGLVNAAAAVTAESYLTVGGEKPKAEMGDSANGVFEFTFEIHNFGDEANTYTLDASLLTEDVVDYSGIYFMAGVDTVLDGTVSFSADEVTVAAGETVEVTVTITLSEDGKAWMNEYYPDGGYVEGYIYVNSEDAASMNLPFLGFYGDWTEPAAFDTAYWYDNSFWGLSPADGLPEGNEYYHTMWTDLGGTSWVLGFNPYTGALADDEGNIIYDSKYNVVSPNGDGVLDSLDDIYLSLMRNAKTLTITYTNADTGEVLDEEVITNARKTMYKSAYGQVVPWLYSWYGEGMYDFTDADGEYLANNTNVVLTFTAEIDYADGGEHTIEIPITVDTEAPELKLDIQYTWDGNYLTLFATDNVALADVFITNKSGTQVWAEQSEFYELTDGLYQITIDVTGLGNEFVVVLCDYGCNEGYYELTYDNFFAGENLPEVDTSKLYAYRVYDNAIYSDHMYGWVSMNMPASEEEYANISAHTDDYLEYAAINAAEYVDGYVFAVDSVYNLVVMKPGLWDRTTVCNLGVNVLDMTFDDSTGTMYVLTKEDYYSYLYTMDLLTGALTMVADYGYYSYGPYAITDDDNGTLYAIKYANSGLYTLDAENGYALTAITDEEGNAFMVYDSNGSKTSPQYAQSIAYVDGVIYWAYYKYSWYGGSSELISINLEDMTTMSSTYTASAYDSDGNLVEYEPVTELVGLHTLTETAYEIPEAEALESLWMDSERVVMGIGDTTKLKANPLPWNYKVTDMVWTSSDESVATVDANGKVTAVSEGNAIITAASGDITAECLITVVDVDGSFNAYNYYSGDSNYGYMIEVDLGKVNYKLTSESPVDFYAADYNGHNGYYYGYTENGQLWRMDLENNEAVKLGDPIGSAPADMAYDYSTGLMYAIKLDYNSGYSSLCVVNLNNGQLEELYRLDYVYMMTLACDLEGNLYTITSDGMLVELSYVYDDMFDEYSWVTNVLMYDMGYLQYMQSMCYDYANDVILWAYPENGSLYWIDVNNEYPYVLSLGDPTGSGVFEFVGMYTVPETIYALPPVAVESVEVADITMLVDAVKTPNLTVRPFNATCQNVVWTSGDESVVAVNSDGALVGVGAGTATVTGVLEDTVGGQSYELSFNVTVIQGADDVYGMVMTDIATYGGQYWVRLYAVDPSDPDVLNSTDYVLYAEEYYNGKLYAFGYDANDWEANWQFLVMNPSTYVIEEQYDMGEGFPFVYDMTYDYTTSTMYAVAGTNSASDLYAVDMETGKLVLLMQTEEFFLSLTATPDGTLFAIEQSQEEFDEMTYSSVYANAKMYVLDPYAGTVEEYSDTGIISNMLASMNYDYDTDYIYWTPFASTSAYISNLAMIDPETGKAAALGTIGTSGAQVTGLYIISENFPEEPELSLKGLFLDTSKTVVNVGNSVSVGANALPLQLETEITWTSSDETVATVENGVITGVSQGSATITATTTYNGVTKTASCTVAVLNNDASFLSWNKTDMGWSAISRADYTVVTNLTEGEEVGVQAVDAANGVVYGYDANDQLFTLDTTTYERTAIGESVSEDAILGYINDNELDIDTYPVDTFGFEVHDMAYDAANERMLVLGNVMMYDPDWEEFSEINSGCSIYTVDLATGEIEKLYNFSDTNYIYGMACDENGMVYYYTTFDDGIYKLDLASGSVSRIISLQTQSLYGEYGSDIRHAMYYDELTDILYMQFTSNGSFYRMITCDPATGALTLVSNIGEVTRVNYTNTGDLFAGMVFADVTYPAESEEPVEPSEPVEPEEPTESVEPSDPEEPTESVEPSDPEEPTESVEPSEPVEPSDPVEPSEPAEPSDPVEPSEPAEPSDPVEPSEPAEPSEPVEPSEPDVPVEPDVPEVPEKEFPFTDVPAWARTAVNYLYQRDIVAGMSSTQFGSYSAVTRAQAVTMIWRYVGSPESENGNVFADVSDTAYYAEAVAWASENGIVSGVGNNQFAPNQAINREQLVVILYRLAQYQGYDMSISESIGSFKDAGTTSSWALDAIRWAYGNGMISGTTAGILSPKGTATRVEFAQVLYKYIIAQG